MGHCKEKPAAWALCAHPRRRDKAHMKEWSWLATSYFHPPKRPRE